MNRKNNKDKENNNDVPKDAPEEGAGSAPPEAEGKEFFRDKYLRALAELDNARKRIQKDREDFTKFANESLLTELFPVMDSFDGAIAHVNKSTDKEAFLKGVRLIQEQFHKVLEDNGLTAIKTVGQKFDPVLHEAIEQVEKDDAEDGIIVEEIRKGYLLNGRVLRPAIVKIAVKPKTEEV